MGCNFPIKAYRLTTEKTEKGKNVIVFDRNLLSKKPYETIFIGCGQCSGCRVDRAKAWAIRCIHEASLYENNCFITLTFDSEHMDEKGSLRRGVFSRFMKDLRKKFRGLEPVKNDDGVTTFPIRFFHAAEYGDLLNRPHHHACLFNFDFLDKKLWSVRQGVKLYRSETLESIWKKGYCTVGNVTYESAAYVARYCLKKMNGRKKEEGHYMRVDSNGEVYELEPEFTTMSRRPGIAKRWFDKFGKEVHSKDFVTHGGRKFKTPKYYDHLYDVIDHDGMIKVAQKRKKKARLHPEEKTIVRGYVRSRILDKRMKRLERSIHR